jgi:nucleoside-diphosphate-sugar epimerase
MTGAFGYSGRYISGRLLDAGHEVTTLTNSIQRANPFGDKIKVCGFHQSRCRFESAVLQRQSGVGNCAG